VPNQQQETDHACRNLQSLPIQLGVLHGWEKVAAPVNEVGKLDYLDHARTSFLFAAFRMASSTAPRSIAPAL
jgi:hypothetical protein